ncbi:MAG TPA: hypothetical protein VF062_23615 [Candidatus Limnocylindrales bacterium]
MYVGAIVLLLLPLPGLLRLPVLAWYVLFMLAALWYLGRHLFGADEVHPFLGPAVGFLTVTLATIVNLIEFAAGDGLPGRVGLLITLSGWTTTMVLTAAEAGHCAARCVETSSCQPGSIGYRPCRSRRGRPLRRPHLLIHRTGIRWLSRPRTPRSDHSMAV